MMLLLGRSSVASTRSKFCSCKVKAVVGRLSYDEEGRADLVIGGSLCLGRRVLDYLVLS